MPKTQPVGGRGIKKKGSYFFLSLSLHLVLLALLMNHEVVPIGSQRLRGTVAFKILGSTATNRSYEWIEQGSRQMSIGRKGIKNPDTKKSKVSHLIKKPKNVSTEQQVEKTLGSQASADGGFSDSPLGQYLWHLRKLIEKNKEYPILAKRLGQQGIVEVEFTISRDGRLISINRLSSSKELLAKAVRELLRSKMQFPKFPSQLHQSALTVTIPIRFEIKD